MNKFSANYVIFRLKEFSYKIKVFSFFFKLAPQVVALKTKRIQKASLLNQFDTGESSYFISEN